MILENSEITPYWKERQAKILEKCVQKYYKPSETMEYYDSETDTWYKNDGTPLMNPSVFEPDEDGCYTPFGDE